MDAFFFVIPDMIGKLIISNPNIVYTKILIYTNIQCDDHLFQF